MRRNALALLFALLGRTPEGQEEHEEDLANQMLALDYDEDVERLLQQEDCSDGMKQELSRLKKVLNERKALKMTKK